MQHIDHVHEGDLQVIDGYVVVSGTVTGNVVVASGRLTLTGMIAGNVTVRSGTVQLMGAVGGNVMNLGGDVVVAGPVGGEITGQTQRTIIELDQVPERIEAAVAPISVESGGDGLVVPAPRDRSVPSTTTLAQARDLASGDDFATGVVLSAARRRSTGLQVAAAAFVVMVIIVVVAALALG